MSKRVGSIFLSALMLFVALPSFADVNVVFEQDGILHKPISDENLCVSYYSNSPFELNVIADSIAVGVTGAGFLAATLGRTYTKYPDFNGVIFDSSAVSGFDRWAMRPYSKGLDTFGTVVSVTDAILPVVAYGVEFLFSNLPKKDGLTVAVMYLESLFLSNAIKEVVKLSVHRVRPYMYFENYDKSAIKFHDFEMSMPSGHTVNAFMGATFLSYTFCQYYPDSVWRIPVIATSYALAIGTGALRMASGNHFFSDVLAGAAIGSACGFLVPFAHTFIAKANQRLAVYSEKTGAPKIELAAAPLVMNVSIKF